MSSEVEFASINLDGPTLSIEYQWIEYVSIEATRKTYLETDLKLRLAPCHADPDSTFRVQKG
jgi:hypothetical protein